MGAGALRGGGKGVWKARLSLFPISRERAMTHPFLKDTQSRRLFVEGEMKKEGSGKTSSGRKRTQGKKTKATGGHNKDPVNSKTKNTDQGTEPGNSRGEKDQGEKA